MQQWQQRDRERRDYIKKSLTMAKDERRAHEKSLHEKWIAQPQQEVHHKTGDGTQKQAGAEGEESTALPDTRTAELSATALAAAEPREQKNMLGRVIYPRVAARLPKVAYTQEEAEWVTGKMLQMDNDLLIEMVQEFRREALDEKIDDIMIHD